MSFTVTSIDTGFPSSPTPQLALMAAEYCSVSLKKCGRTSKDELREIRNACLEHEGTDLSFIISRWENFNRITAADILRIGLAFSIEKNGCGPAGWKGALVPERPATMLWLVSFEKACNIHDILYGIGGDWVARMFADLYFRRMMVGACRKKLMITWALHLRWGERTAELYYSAVSKHGKPFFKLNHQRKEVIV